MPPIVNRYTRLVGIDHPIVQERTVDVRLRTPSARGLSAEPARTDLETVSKQ